MMRFVNRLKPHYKEIVLVLTLSALVTIISSTALISQYLRRPPDHVFIGLSHYWEDFYYYLDQFHQGAHGGWTVANNFTSERFSPTLIYFDHLLLGKIGSIIGLSPFTTYNISVVLFKFLFISSSYLILLMALPKQRRMRVFAFVIFLFSSSFPFLSNTGENVTLTSMRIFRTANTVFTRFGNIPDQLIRNLLAVFCFLLLVKILKSLLDNKSPANLTIHKLGKVHFLTLILLGFLFAFISISNSIRTIVMVTAAGLIVISRMPKMDRFRYLINWSLIGLPIMLPSILLMFYLFFYVKHNPIFSYALDWDVKENLEQLQLLYENPALFVMSFGTLGVTTILGLFHYLRKKRNIAETLSVNILIISLAGYLLPIYRLLPVAGFRFFSSLMYIYAAIVAAYTLEWLSSKLRMKNGIIILFIYLVPNLVTLSSSIYNNSRPVNKLLFHLVYIPNKVYDGFKVLEALPPKDALVIANPYQSIDVMIPGLTGKRIYSGHLLMTYNSKEKDVHAGDFLYKWTDQKQALNFLLENKIEYVVWTLYDGDVKQVKRDYSFLQPVYENDMISIFTISKS